MTTDDQTTEQDQRYWDRVKSRRLAEIDVLCNQIPRIDEEISNRRRTIENQISRIIEYREQIRALENTIEAKKKAYKDDYNEEYAPIPAEYN